jgi:hypothetical protein
LLAGSLLKCALAMKAGSFAAQGLGLQKMAKSQLLSSLLGRGAGWKVTGYARPDARGEKTSRRYGERKGASLHVIKIGGCKGAKASMALMQNSMYADYSACRH